MKEGYDKNILNPINYPSLDKNEYLEDNLEHSIDRLNDKTDMKPTLLDEEKICFQRIKSQEKRDLISKIMMFRTEMMSSEKDITEELKTDFLNNYWENPNDYFILWILRGSRNIGLMSMVVEKANQGRLVEIFISNTEVDDETENTVIHKMLEFAEYRGLKELTVPHRMFRKVNDIRKNIGYLYIKIHPY
jgi:hypothetical protein